MQAVLIGTEYDHRLNHQRVVPIAIGVFIVFAHEVSVRSDNAAGQKSSDVQLLPNGQVFSDNDRDFGIKHDGIGAYKIGRFYTTCYFVGR